MFGYARRMLVKFVGVFSLLAIAMPACTQTLPATPAPPEAAAANTGRISGKVLGEANAPVSFANIIVLGTKQGTMSDETGAFIIAGVPVGTYQVKLQAIGCDPIIQTVQVNSGETAVVNFSVGQSRFNRLRDSLQTIGRWPPTLDPELNSHMRAAEVIRVFRLGRARLTSGSPQDSGMHVGPWQIAFERHHPSRSAVLRLVDSLRSSKRYVPALMGVMHLCGGFQPGIDVRFIHDGVPVDLLLCYVCGEFSIWRSGHGVQAGFFDNEPFFLHFARSMFPADSAFKEIEKRYAEIRRR